MLYVKFRCHIIHVMLTGEGGNAAVEQGNAAVEQGHAVCGCRNGCMCLVWVWGEWCISLPSPWHDHASQIQTYTQCTRIHTGSLGPQPQHLGKYHLFSINNCIHSPATYTPNPPPIQRLIHHSPPTPTLDTYYGNHTLHVPAPPLHFHPVQWA